jgi:hypothetical protein
MMFFENLINNRFECDIGILRYDIHQDLHNPVLKIAYGQIGDKAQQEYDGWSERKQEMKSY